MFGKWKIWNGGAQPVASGKAVMVQRANQTRDSAISAGSMNAETVTWSWAADGAGDDIVAYCVELESRTVRLFGNSLADNPVFRTVQAPGDDFMLEYTIVGGVPLRSSVQIGEIT